MKRKLILLLTAAIALTACSSKSFDEIKKDVSENISEIVNGDKTAKGDAATKGETSANGGTAADNSSSEDYIDSTVRLEENTEFSSGRAWVKYDESKRNGAKLTYEDLEKIDKNDPASLLYYGSMFSGNGRRWALIDETGKILWHSDESTDSLILTDISEFKDGLAYFTFNDGSKKEYRIIDIDGNITFTKEISDDYLILCHGGGMFFVAQHVSNLDTNEWQIGAIDKNGNTVLQFSSYSIYPPNAVNQSNDWENSESFKIDIPVDYYRLNWESNYHHLPNANTF